MGSFSAAVRAWAVRIAAIALTALAASCGGGSGPDAPPVVTAQSAQFVPSAAAASTALTPDQLMDWAEARYPDLFPAAGKVAGYFAPYQFRHYAGTDNYLGVSVGSADVAIYIYGPVAAWQITRVAALTDYTCTVLPQNCASFSPNVAFYGDSEVPFVALNLGVLMPDRVVFQGGAAAESSTQVAARVIADTDRHSWINVLWMGTFNSDDPVSIKRDIAASVAALPPNAHFLVLGIMNEAVPEDYKGTAKWQSIVQLNSELAVTYPQNYFDVRSYLVGLYNPNNAQDVQDFQHDVVPSSLRSDAGHLNNDGSVAVATKVKALILAKGW
jgi:hypothetical protein